jgi:hypothetical protein
LTIRSFELERKNPARSSRGRFPPKTLLGKTPTCYCGDGWAALNLWPEAEVKHPNAVKINLVIFHLNNRSSWTEFPLLLDQWTECVSVIR